MLFFVYIAFFAVYFLSVELLFSSPINTIPYLPLLPVEAVIFFALLQYFYARQTLGFSMNVELFCF